MRQLRGRVAVVTGAAGGIGRAISRALAQRGCELALVDKDAAGLRGAQSDIEQAGGKASVHVTDVADRVQMERLPESILQSHPAIHLLINNAGVSLAGPLEQVSLDDFAWIVGINFWGVVYGCKLFLPHLRRAAEAHIVTILSDFALIGCPTKSAYSATKFAARGFSEALRAELYGTRVGLTCVYPGPADTGIVRNGRTWDPIKAEREAEFLAQRGIPLEVIASRVIRGIERNAARVLIGRETYAMDLMQRLSPTLTDALAGRLRKRLPFL
jgi:short-subunit dehydrogenase